MESERECILALDINTIFNMQNKILIWLTICGSMLVVSALSGVASVSFLPDKIVITHYSSVILRVFSIALGFGLIFIAWLLRKKHLLGWRLFFLVQVIAWICFVVGGTKAVTSNYPDESVKDDFLFAFFLALVSGPVVGYWCWRWRKEKKNYFSNDNSTQLRQ